MSEETNVDPVRAYFAAGRRYKSAQAEAKQMIALIKKAGSAMDFGQLPYFIAYNYNLDIPGLGAPPVYVRRERVNVDDWPDRQRVEQVLRELHGAFVELHAAWRRVPSEERESPGLGAPPRDLAVD